MTDSDHTPSAMELGSRREQPDGSHYIVLRGPVRPVNLLGRKHTGERVVIRRPLQETIPALGELAIEEISEAGTE